MRLGMPEMLIILVVVMLVFGANKIPQLGDALGKGIRNFKRAAEGDGVLGQLQLEERRTPVAAQAKAAEAVKEG